MIWLFCTRETSVHLPCRIISWTDWIEGFLEVKGAATDASPSLIIGKAPASRASSPSPSLAAAIAAADAVKPPPAFCIRALFASCSLAMTFLNAFAEAISCPSPCATRRLTSISTFFIIISRESALCWLPLSFLSLFTSAACAATAAALRLSKSTLSKKPIWPICSSVLLNSSSISATFCFNFWTFWSATSRLFSVFRLPKPPSNATPT
mmetsp:Transcript_10012/g.19059  ORF Transcript_10012/g.19059 Transcript_10012/m.19059 type:complete len:209 (-) Transcript_10012:3116-3742(-)